MSQPTAQSAISRSFNRIPNRTIMQPGRYICKPAADFGDDQIWLVDLFYVMDDLCYRHPETLEICSVSESIHSFYKLPDN